MTPSWNNPPLAYCFTCKGPMPMTNPIVKTTRTGRHLLVGECPNCHFTISRFAHKEDQNDGQPK